jgi:hypothetical protein
VVAGGGGQHHSSPNLVAALKTEEEEEEEEEEQAGETDNVDDRSIVSSLSNDDSYMVRRDVDRRRLPFISEHDAARTLVLPPVEVSVPNNNNNNSKTDGTAPTPVAAHNKSNSTLDDLVAQLAIRSSASLSSSSSPVKQQRLAKPSIVARAQTCPMPSSIQPNIMNTPSGLSTTETNSTSNTDELLGDRKRRPHRRTPSLTGTIDISIGSIVGQSTAPTITSSSTTRESEGGGLSLTPKEIRRSMQSAVSAQRKLASYGEDHGMSVGSVRKRANPVKEELKYIMGVMSTPIRKIPLLKKKGAELQRSRGTLT